MATFERKMSRLESDSETGVIGLRRDFERPVMGRDLDVCWILMISGSGSCCGGKMWGRAETGVSVFASAAFFREASGDECGLSGVPCGTCARLRYREGERMPDMGINVQNLDSG